MTLVRRVLGGMFGVCVLGSLLTSAVFGEDNPVHSVPYTWRNVEIVGGGFVPGIVFSTKAPDLIYARTDIGGAYRWDPQTKRWIPLTDWVGWENSNLLGIESIAPDPVDADRVYLAAGMYTQLWASNAAILRSGDRGRTWRKTDLPFKMGGNEDGRSIGERLAVDPSLNSILYLGSRHNGLWVSRDSAATWQQVSAFPVKGQTDGAGVGFVVFDASSGQSGKPTPTIYIGVSTSGTNLYRSTDAGATWQAVADQPKGLMPHHGVLDSDGTLYLSYGNGPGPNGMTDGAVWKLDTHAGTWRNISPLTPGKNGEATFGYAGLTVDRQHPGTVMVATMDRWAAHDDIFRSTDGGKTWKSVNAHSTRDSSAAPFMNWGHQPPPPLGHWIGSLEIDPFHPGHALYGTGATIWASDDADVIDHDQMSHWTVGAQGLEETAVLELISPPTGAHLLSAIGDLGGFRHDDFAASPPQGMFDNPIFTTGTGIDFAEKAPSIVARVGNGQPGKCGAYSIDGGSTWAPFAKIPADGHEGGTIAVAADGSAFVWAPHEVPAHVSTDRGAMWTACKGLGAGAEPVADRVNPQKFYALEPTSGALFVSTDGGVGFSPAPAKLPADDRMLRAMPGKEGDLWLTATKGGLYHSTDSGASFAKLGSVAEAYAVGFGKTAPGHDGLTIYLGGKVGDTYGVFRSDDTGKSWLRINDDQHQYGWIGQCVTGDPRVYGRVYIATNGRGILYADPAHSP